MVNRQNSTRSHFWKFILNWEIFLQSLYLRIGLIKQRLCNRVKPPWFDCRLNPAKRTFYWGSLSKRLRRSDVTWIWWGPFIKEHNSFIKKEWSWPFDKARNSIRDIVINYFIKLKHLNFFSEYFLTILNQIYIFLQVLLCMHHQQNYILSSFWVMITGQ